ncbi:MSHA biogenesis protein MshG, partial [mine drainage metagenome]
PLPTRIILAISDFASHYWLLVLALIAISTLAARIYIRTGSGRYRFDALKLKIPVLGPVALRGGLARFARAFAMSLRSGVPVVQAMGLIAQSVGNEYLGERILAMRTGINGGNRSAGPPKPWDSSPRS